MRHLIFFIIMLGSSVVNAQMPELFTPPNGVRLYNNVFIDSSEVAIIHWLEYQFYAKDSSVAYYQSTMIDSTVWQGLLSSGELVSQAHYKHPSYRYYPVVGVTRQQAVAYCKWRSEAVNSMIRREINENNATYENYKNYHY